MRSVLLSASRIPGTESQTSDKDRNSCLTAHHSSKCLRDRCGPGLAYSTLHGGRIRRVRGVRSRVALNRRLCIAKPSSNIVHRNSVAADRGNLVHGWSLQEPRLQHSCMTARMESLIPRHSSHLTGSTAVNFHMLPWSAMHRSPGGLLRSSWRITPRNWKARGARSGPSR